MRRLTNALVSAAFLVIISLPLAVNLAGVDGADAEAENRTLAAWPPLDGTWDSIGSVGHRLADWFEDHFGLRAQLVRWYGKSRYFWLHVSPSPLVILGNDGWLFYREDGGLDDFTNHDPLSAEATQNWRATIVRARDWCRARGMGYVFTVLPDKHVIYPEYFSPAVRQMSTLSRTDQVVAASFDTGVVVDVRPALLAAKSSGRLYHVTDTHWNQRGAFVAYQQIIEAVRGQVPGVGPARALSEFDLVSRDVEAYDLASMIGLKRVLRENDLGLRPRVPRVFKVLEPAGGYATGGDGRIVSEIPGSTLPRAVMFRDSFTSALAPFLSEHFSRIVYLWQNDLDANAVLREHPDVVIQEIVGRHLYGFVPSPELVPTP
jgi:alginate O-acetyltransferase complex protein AlgJ